MRIRSLLVLAVIAAAPLAAFVAPSSAEARPCRNVPGSSCCTESRYPTCKIIPYRW